MIFVEIDLTTDSITRYSQFLERNLTGNPIVVSIEDGVPKDYDISRYDYQPRTPGVYDPEGWIPKIIPSTDTFSDGVHTWERYAEIGPNGLRFVLTNLSTQEVRYVNTSAE